LAQGYFYIAVSLPKLSVRCYLALYRHKGYVVCITQGMNITDFGDLKILLWKPLSLQNATLWRGELERMFQHIQCAEALNSLKFNVNFLCGCAYFKAALCYLPDTSVGSTTNSRNSVSYSPNFISRNYCQWPNINFLILVTLDIEIDGFLSVECIGPNTILN